jgi:hypothetical protein
VAGGADVEAELCRLARLVAGFHAGPSAARRPTGPPGRDALVERWAANTAGLLADGPGVVELDDVLEVDGASGSLARGPGRCHA